MDKDQLAKDLYDARLMRNPAEVEAFEEARTSLVDTGDLEVLTSLLSAFDDSTEQMDVMWGLVHDVEAFELDPSLRALARLAPTLLPHAKDWLVLLHERVLNSKEARPTYVEIVRTLSEAEQAAIGEVMRVIEVANPKLSKRARELLKAIDE